MLLLCLKSALSYLASGGGRKLNLIEYICLAIFSESRDYNTQMVYLQGLANMELSQVLEFLIPVITGQETGNRHLRFLASWATLHTVNTDSAKVIISAGSLGPNRNRIVVQWRYSFIFWDISMVPYHQYALTLSAFAKLSFKKKI